MKIDAILSPAELPLLARRDLRQTACVVFDVLRATSTFVTALHHGAKGIIPVGEISEALAIKKKQPDVLLGGERNGVRISVNGVDFDFGNSPREYTPEKVRGKTIISTTTNGTRALRACTGAKLVLAASFLNLMATAEFLRQEKCADILLVCAGTGERPASEDIIAAGTFAEQLTACGEVHSNAAGTMAARAMYLQAKEMNLEKRIGFSENARRLLAIPELREDVAFCLQRDVFPLVARMESDGAIKKHQVWK